MLWLALYALLGKGFAYAGFPPLYVGEILLIPAVLVPIFARRLSALIRTPIGAIFTIFLAWQMVCTVPYLESYQMDALRDSVLWIYAAFAWAVGALLLRLPGLLESVISRYARFARIYIFLGPVAWLASVYLDDWLPHWPGTTVSIPLLKAGEYCVHMAGIFAFLFVGLRKMSRWWLLLVFGDALLGMSGRGGLIALLVASSFVLLLKPSWKRLTILLSFGLVLLMAMAVFEVRIATPKESREFSLDQLSSSITSTLAGSENTLLEGTRAWRLAWWGKIWDYTVNGDFFWTGKGYGINLADADGFQVASRDEPLRSPHSSHLTFLARSGVPGMLFWVILQATWAWSMLTSHFRARARGDENWANLFAWVLAYWLAFMVSAAFDVFLEGPMAGIPFWTLFGFGWGAHMLFQSKLKRSQRVNLQVQFAPSMG